MIRFLAVILAAVVLGACGGDEGETEAETLAIPGDAAHEDVRVIDQWASTLAAGDVDGAAELFALPSVAENGILLQIEDFQDAVRFNASLPCGAELIAAETQGKFTTATFRLQERPGPGTCGDGVGETAQTAFVIEDELIVEWRRVGLPTQESPAPIT